jgi:hypothetical protein
MAAHTDIEATFLFAGIDYVTLSLDKMIAAGGFGPSGVDDDMLSRDTQVRLLNFEFYLPIWFPSEE